MNAAKVTLTEAEKESLGLYDLARCPDCNASVAAVESIVAARVVQTTQWTANEIEQVCDHLPWNRFDGACICGHIRALADEYVPRADS